MSTAKRKRWVTAFGFVVRDANGREHFGHTMVARKLRMSPGSDEVWSLIRDAIRWSRPVEPLEMIDFQGSSIAIR